MAGRCVRHLPAHEAPAEKRYESNHVSKRGHIPNVPATHEDRPVGPHAFRVPEESSHVAIASGRLDCRSLPLLWSGTLAAMVEQARYLRQYDEAICRVSPASQGAPAVEGAEREANSQRHGAGIAPLLPVRISPRPVCTILTHHCADLNRRTWVLPISRRRSGGLAVGG
jgi:hypothetical protein